GPTPTGAVQFTINGKSYGSPVTLSGGTASIIVTTLPAGIDHITAVYSGDSTYATSTGLTSQTVVRAHLTVTADNASQTYDGSVLSGFTAHYTGFVNGDTQAVIFGAPSFIGTAVTAVDAGNYTITPGAGSLSAANYDFTLFVNATLTITKAHLTVT